MRSLLAPLVCMKHPLFHQALSGRTTTPKALRLATFMLVKLCSTSHSETDNSRDVLDKVHFCLVADAGQFGVHCLTFRTSGCLIGCGHRCVEAVVVVVVTE